MKKIISALFLCLLHAASYSMYISGGNIYHQVKNNLLQEMTQLINQNVDHQDPRWITFFLKACRLSEVMRTLLESGENPNIQLPGTLITPLHQTAELCNLDSMELLLNHNAQPNLQNDKGETPLMLAVMLNQESSIDNEIRSEAVLKLLNAGADNSIVNAKGRRASDIARINSFKKIAHVIENFRTSASLKNLCIEFIKNNRQYYTQNEYDTLPIDLEQLFRKCDYCKLEYTMLNQLKRCSRCKVVYYCDQKCQKLAWPNHRFNCKI